MGIRKAYLHDIKAMSLVWSEAINSINLNAIENTFNLFIKLGECLVIDESQGIIATSCFIPYVNSSWIGNVGVSKNYQRRGYGRKLMIELLNRIRTSVTGLDATEAGFPLYRELGFREVYNTVIYNISEVGEQEVNVGDRLERWMLELDKEAFGDDRSLLLQELVMSGGKVISLREGFGIIYQNVLGPLIATDEEIAERLIRGSVRLGTRTIITLEDKGKFLADIGGKKTQYGCIRMMRGKEIGNKKLLWSIFRWAFG
ncbi:hypothetical protein HS7_02180 [Sulfolobales archaeon HS-7]|nr:hypothetical protein HS7_02180 [Sulfolobales archaeon HS-7]